MTSEKDPRVLVLTPRFPYPLEAGDTLRIYHLCRALSERCSLTLLSLCETERDMTIEPEGDIFDRIERVWHPAWRGWLHTATSLPSRTPLQLAYYRSSTFQQRVDELVPQHDLALAHLCRTGQYLEGIESIPTVLEMTDALSLNYRRVREQGSFGFKRLLYRMESSRMEAYEVQSIQAFDLVSLVSDVDRQFLVQQGPGGSAADHVRVYTNGIDLQDRVYHRPGSDSVVAFIGNMRTVHNRIACEYFIDRVLPLVRSSIPDITFRIVGAAPDSVHAEYEDIDGVEVTGWVDSISSATRDAICGLGTMQVAGGLQNKILEYMALGIPVVANKMGLEGIDVGDGREVLIGDSPEAVADHIITLYNTPELRERLSREARHFVEANHRWSGALEPYVDDVMDLGGQTR